MFRTIFSFVAKKRYQKQYQILKQNLYSACCKMNETGILRSRNLEEMLVLGEDHRFRYHIGFDVIAIARAFRNRFLYNKIEGASTIEQQLVRVLIDDFQKTPKRKIKEIFLATTLSELVPTEEIPRIYLHVAYYGANMDGLPAVYTKMNLSLNLELTDEKAAEIVARIKYPEPQAFSEKKQAQILRRKNHILTLKYRYYRHKKLIP